MADDLIFLADVLASATSPPDNFAAAIASYRGFTVPICAPELARPYERFNAARDRAFVRSLSGTPLEARWRNAVRDDDARREGTVFHCDGPPSPPGSPEAKLSPRAQAIAREQARLRAVAADLPGFFDAGDAAFAQLTALRDATLAPKVP